MFISELLGTTNTIYHFHLFSGEEVVTDAPQDAEAEDPEHTGGLHLLQPDSRE